MDGAKWHATATAKPTAHPSLSVWLVTNRPRPTPPAPTATTRTSKGMDWGKVAHHRYGKAHGSPSLERVAGHDPPTSYATCTPLHKMTFPQIEETRSYATCTPLHTTPPSKGMDWGKVARHRYDKAQGSPILERVTGDDPPMSYATCTDSDNPHQQGHEWGQEGTPPLRQSPRLTQP